MGLDMYMHKKSYVKNWGHMKPEELHTIAITKNGKETHIKPERINEIVEQIGYWRKANAIHSWFVKNVQDGNDDCKEYEVSSEQLKELLDTTNRVLESSKLIDGKVHNGTIYKEGKKEEIYIDGKIIEDSSVAEELLPTEEGFLFGGTSYDQYYIDDLKETKKIIEEALVESEYGSIYYSSSW